MIRPLPIPSPDDDDDDCISAESSVHQSDYDSEDSSLDEDDSEAHQGLAMIVGGDTSTISKSSLASMSLTTTVGNATHQHSPTTLELLSAADTSSSSSTGDDGWKTESSSASNLSSTGDNSIKYEEARRHLHSRQKIRRTISNTSGSNFCRPIDVESLKRNAKLHSSCCDDKLVAAEITRQRLGFEDNLSEAPTVGHRIIGFATAAGRKQMLQGCSTTIPHEVPVPSHDDDISAIGGQTPSYRELKRMMDQRKAAADIEKGTEQAQSIGEEIRCVSNRSDFEMFLILVIAASLVTLVVLLGLILKTRG